MGLDIKCYPDGMYGENTYLITDDATGFKAIIDPGYYGVDVKMDIQNNTYLKYVLLTHGHHDHYLEAQEYVDEYSAVRFAVPEKEMALIHGQPYGCPEPTMLLKDGDIITLGETELRVIETPGHTGGGVCFALCELQTETCSSLGCASRHHTGIPTDARLLSQSRGWGSRGGWH